MTSSFYGKIMKGIFVVLFFIFLLSLNIGIEIVIVIFIAIVLLTIIISSGSSSKKILIVTVLSVLFLIFAIFSGLVETDLGESEEKIEQSLFRISHFEGDAKYDKGYNWMRIQGGEEQSVFRIVSYVDTYPEISFGYKGDSSAYFQMKVSDLNSPPNLIYEDEAVNFSEAGKKYVKTHKEGGNKNREILIKIIVPAGATVEITNFTVVSA